MTTTIPTEQEIRTMDGPALTRLAYTLGLAPSDVQYVEDKKPGWWRGEMYQGLFIPLQRWHPHDDLTQARECLDRLREYGYNTSVRWLAQEAQRGIIVASLTDSEGRYYERVTTWQCSTKTEEEVRATLLCACLARAAQLREESQTLPAQE